MMAQPGQSPNDTPQTPLTKHAPRLNGLRTHLYVSHDEAMALDLADYAAALEAELAAARAMSLPDATDLARLIFETEDESLKEFYNKPPTNYEELSLPQWERRLWHAKLLRERLCTLTPGSPPLTQQARQLLEAAETMLEWAQEVLAAGYIYAELWDRGKGTAQELRAAIAAVRKESGE